MHVCDRKQCPKNQSCCWRDEQHKNHQNRASHKSRFQRSKEKNGPDTYQPMVLISNTLQYCNRINCKGNGALSKISNVCSNGLMVCGSEPSMVSDAMATLVGQHGSISQASQSIHKFSPCHMTKQNLILLLGSFLLAVGIFIAIIVVGMRASQEDAPVYQETYYTTATRSLLPSQLGAPTPMLLYNTMEPPNISMTVFGMRPPTAAPVIFKWK